MTLTTGPVMSTEPPRRSRAAALWEDHGRRAVVITIAALVALVVSRAAPLAGPLLVALLLGAVVTNAPRLGPGFLGRSPRMDKLFLRAGIVLLGLKVVFADVLALGASGLTVVLVTVAVTFALTHWIGGLLGVPLELRTLIAAGFSICGAAAIAAVESSVRAKSKDVAVAVALVTVFGSVMIGVVPALGGLLGLSPTQMAVWAGASVHEVAQVVATASVIGGGAAVVATAMTVKLARVVLLAPVQVLSARLCDQEAGARRGPVVPTFVVGFLVAVAVRSTGVLSAEVLAVASDLTTVLLAAAMFGLGTNLVWRSLWPLPIRAVLLGTASTLVAATTSLVLVATLV